MKYSLLQSVVSFYIKCAMQRYFASFPTLFLFAQSRERGKMSVFFLSILCMQNRGPSYDQFTVTFDVEKKEFIQRRTQKENCLPSCVACLEKFFEKKLFSIIFVCLFMFLFSILMLQKKKAEKKLHKSLAFTWRTCIWFDFIK